MAEPLLGVQDLSLCYLGGSIAKVDQQRFKKLMFRTTRGKAFTQFFDMEVSPEDKLKGMGNIEEKSIYIVMF